jgi:hypothetical protein
LQTFERTSPSASARPMFPPPMMAAFISVMSYKVYESQDHSNPSMVLF